MTRAFIALELPGDIKANLAELSLELKRELGSAVRWVRPEGLHLTLKFFGDLRDDELALAKEALREAGEGARAFHLEASGLGVFPARGQPRVVWVGLSGELAPLEVLQEGLEVAAAKRGFARDQRPFRPHLTLGRVKVPQPELQALVTARRTVTLGRFQARRLALFKSELLPAGAKYTALQELLLAP